MNRIRSKCGFYICKQINKHDKEAGRSRLGYLLVTTLVSDDWKANELILMEDPHLYI